MAALVQTKTWAATGADTAVRFGRKRAVVLVDGTFSATIALQWSIDNTTWYTAKTWTAAMTEQEEFVTLSADHYWRLNCTAYSSGSPRGVLTGE